jgi:hypothetical protein
VPRTGCRRVVMRSVFGSKAALLFVAIAGAVLVLAGCGGSGGSPAAGSPQTSSGNTSALSTTRSTTATSNGSSTSGTAHATSRGPGAGTFSGGTCTTAGGDFYVTIGRAHQGSYFSIVVATPTAAGPVAGGLIQWGDRAKSVAIGATTSSITFDTGLRSGSFTGSAINASQLQTAPGSGTFACK